MVNPNQGLAFLGSHMKLASSPARSLHQNLFPVARNCGRDRDRRGQRGSFGAFRGAEDFREGGGQKNPCTSPQHRPPWNLPDSYPSESSRDPILRTNMEEFRGGRCATFPLKRLDVSHGQTAADPQMVCFPLVSKFTTLCGMKCHV